MVTWDLEESFAMAWLSRPEVDALGREVSHRAPKMAG
jgi:hypothetical protein